MIGSCWLKGVIWKANSAGKIFDQKFRDCFIRKAEIDETFAIRFADELAHKALPPLETLNFIKQLFGSVRVIAKNDPVGLCGGGRRGLFPEGKRRLW